jgi:hypothetical protein
MIIDESERVRAAAYALYEESQSLQPGISAIEVAERAGLEKDQTIQILFELNQAGRLGILGFYRSNDPDGSRLICPIKDENQ